MAGRLANAAAAVLLGLPTLLAGCADQPNAVVGGAIAAANPSKGQPGFITGFYGAVVADEPRAASVGRDVLSGGGTAVDAAVATAFALSVTLPSRAALGGGGACLVYAPASVSPNKGAPEAVLFPPPAGKPAPGERADRPAAVPMLARGLYALHAKYGAQPFETLLSPAEALARQGVPASRALARDLAVVGGALAADPVAAQVFFARGAPLVEGAQLQQPALATTLRALRTAGVGDLHQGGLARQIVEASPAAGAGLSPSDLRYALPSLAAPLTLPAADGVTLAFLPADGGLAAAGALETLQRDPAATGAAQARALALAAQARRAGGDPKALLASASLPAADLPSLPASTTFAAVDPQGNAVVCALTMNNLFGTGRVAGTTGILLAASPAALPPALLSAAIAYAPEDRQFRAAVGGSGQAGAPLAAALALRAALADTGRAATPLAGGAPEPGRANVIQCNRGLPDSPRSCGWATDPRGAGVALGNAP